MKLIEEHKPDPVYSLHNAGFTGVYYYVSRDVSSVREELKSVSRKLGIPRHLESKKPAEVIRQGGSSYDYALRYKQDVFELVCEVPYLFDEKLRSKEPIGVSRRETVLLGLDKYEKTVLAFKELVEKLESHTDESNPFHESICKFVRLELDYVEAERRWAETGFSFDRGATVAEALGSLTVSVHWTAILCVGLLYRAAKFAKEGVAVGEARGRAQSPPAARRALGRLRQGLHLLRSAR